MPRRPSHSTSEDFSAPPLPLRGIDPPHRPTPAPAWVALLAAWLGLLDLVLAIVFLLLPGSRNPVAELQHARPYSLKDRFLPIPVYGAAIALFVAIVVFWQMRREPRPLPQALLAQRVQAWAGILLALLAGAVIYGYVAFFGPK